MMKRTLFPNLGTFLSKPIGNLTDAINGHLPHFYGWLFFLITLQRRKNLIEIHFKPDNKVG